MFTRMRWFLYGFAAAIAVTVYLGGRVKRMREKLTAETIARAGAMTAADALEAAGRRLAAPRPGSPTRAAETGEG